MIDALDKLSLPDEKASLSAWIDWLLQLHPTEIDLGVERVKSVAFTLGIQQPKAKVITVAGTNGKGSSVALLAAIYQAAGYQVGCYTSPHIELFNERIKINGQMVADTDLVRAFSVIEQARGQTKLTFFEYATLAGLWLFAQQPLDIVILEVGLGGRLDAVNLVDADAVLVSAIDVDHVDWLGSDRNQIAIEKLGVARANRVCVTSEPDLPQVAIDWAKQNGVEIKQQGKDFTWQLQSPLADKAPAALDVQSTQNAIQNNQAWLFLPSNLNNNDSLLLPLPALKGAFQLQNAAGVLALVVQLQALLPVDANAIRKGLQTVTHFGRLQSYVLNGQTWCIDVAHNPQSAKALADYLAATGFKGQSVFSVLADKEALPMVNALRPYITHWWIADLHVPRAMSVLAIQDCLLQSGVAAENITICQSISEAVAGAAGRSGPCLGWGSFISVAQILASLKSLKEV